ncbi:ferric reductase-like transmembrane domain-containing protein [Rhizobium alvei]|uniref:Ferric reductase-like transmembrane domain-containing protein n=1 Tax=Rhizobium alvei TaxID=1132659 RepID=A0ABT8YSG5_9HYPH|nr:ferric reductase-like transmembrane domain-containing protein [Rhizobium alvei]MDO6966641.1 ferric reductase-like transmembrane domain-containing protein [Rhizobium alvei]
MQTIQHEEARTTGHWQTGVCLGLTVAILCILVVALSPTPTEATRMVIRLTARTSMILFVFAFTASSLLTLARSPATLWLRNNRRYFGLAFAFSHAVHAAALFALWRLNPQLFDDLTTPASFWAGGTGYAIILVMTLTSFPWAASMAGPRAWQIIHKTGAWFLALFFVVNFGRRAVHVPAMYWPYMVILFAAIAIRLWAGYRTRKANGAKKTLLGS